MTLHIQSNIRVYDIQFVLVPYRVQLISPPLSALLLLPLTLGISLNFHVRSSLAKHSGNNITVSMHIALN